MAKVGRLRGTESLPAGKTPEDLVQESVEKVLSGERRWNPRKQPDLLAHLKSVVDSVVNHLAECKEHALVKRFPVTPEAADAAFPEGASGDPPGIDRAALTEGLVGPPPPPSPEEALLMEERDGQIRAMLRSCLRRSRTRNGFGGHRGG